MKRSLAILFAAVLLAFSTTALAVSYSNAAGAGAQEYGLWAGVVLLACAATLCGGGVWRFQRHKRKETPK